MKKRMKVLVSFLFFLFACLAGMPSYAQPSGDDVTSIYDKSYGHAPSPYTGIVPYLVFGAVIIFLAIIGYRYLHDNAHE